MKIGVFDSGVGGESVVNSIKNALPELEVIYETDRENIPYGGKTPARLLELVVPKLRNLEKQDCEVIVVACNTVTTTIIKKVRQQIKTPIIAIEPMIKPACELTKTKKITVCATPATLKSSRYKELLDNYAKDVEVYEPNCSDWAFLVENNQHNIKNIEADIIEPMEKGSDVIVLACTHYHWIEDEIKHIAKGYNASVIQPEEAIVRRLKQVLELA